MYQICRLLVFMLISGSLFAQTDFNIEMVSFTPFDEAGNDVWGYVDDAGVEYAIVGSSRFTRIYSLEDPANPTEVALIQGANSLWRDFKTYGNYIYVTTDQGSDGLTIIDMTNAPEEVTSTLWQPMITNGNNSDVLRTCHNLYIDENGVGYLAGCNVVSGIILVDLVTDPLNPSILGYQSNAYAHDVYVQRDTMYTSDINQGVFSIYDVADKANPVYLGGAQTSSVFTHNAWTSDDGRTLFTTDEVGDAFVDAYDISDLNNISRLDLFQPSETANLGVIPHNTHFLNDYLITSWYTDGLVITDVSSPDNMIKVGSFDTFIGPHGNFNGCWGAYPYLPSGLILASNITNSGNDGNGGLYVLNPNYKRASQLRGRVTNLNTDEPINMATIEIQSASPVQIFSDPSGAFKSGIAETGLFQVSVTHPDYLPLSVDVFLQNGETEILDLEMEPKIAAVLSGNVIKAVDGTFVPNADILIYNDENSFSGKADADGNFSLDLFQGTYTVVVGSWGFLHSSTEMTIDATGSLVIELESGYQDDFVFDHGWNVSGDAQTGAWELGEPNGTFNQGLPSNPDNDESDDLGDQAYVTGNAGGSWFEDDIDNGSTVLTSPMMDLTGYTNPEISLSYWFFNAGGNSQPNDDLVITINNGTDAVTLFEQSTSNPAWMKLEDLAISGLIDITNTMTISAISSDFAGSGHIVEAAIDAFIVTDNISNSTADGDELERSAITPNPFINEITIEWQSNENATLLLLDQTGKQVAKHTINFGSNLIQVSENLIPGVYHAKIVSEDGSRSIQKLVKI